MKQVHTRFPDYLNWAEALHMCMFSHVHLHLHLDMFLFFYMCPFIFFYMFSFILLDVLDVCNFY